jgi:putative SOS response-associated peptidase YedK
MCGRFALKTIPKSLAEVFGLEPPKMEPRPDIRPSEAVPVLLREEVTGRPVFRILTWGLVLPMTGIARKPVRLINARSETLHEKPAFREAFRRRRRLVPASGFYEWRRDGRKRIPFFFTPSDPAVPLVLAGIWEESSEDRSGAFAIITTGANMEVLPVHDRMPVILPPAAWQDWLAPEARKREDVTRRLGPAGDGFLKVDALLQTDEEKEARRRSLFPADWGRDNMKDESDQNIPH